MFASHLNTTDMAENTTKAPSFPAAVIAAERRHWDDTRMLDALRALADDHGALRPGRVRRADRALYETCRHRFGGVAQAAARFGLQIEPARRSWNEREVLEAIRARQASGEGLRSVEVRRDAPALYGRACKRFGNWGAALAAAGAALPAEERALSDSELLAAVETHRTRNGGPLPSSLAVEIRRRYGSVRGFYESHGLSARWTPRQIVAELRKYGRPPSVKEVRQVHPGFYFAALRLFPGWSAAIRAAFPAHVDGHPRRRVPAAEPRSAVPPWAADDGRWLVPQQALDSAWAYVLATPPDRRISCREVAQAAGVTAPSARRMLLSMCSVGAVTEVAGARVTFRRAGGADPLCHPDAASGAAAAPYGGRCRGRSCVVYVHTWWVTPDHRSQLGMVTTQTPLGGIGLGISGPPQRLSKARGPGGGAAPKVLSSSAPQGPQRRVTWSQGGGSPTPVSPRPFRQGHPWVDSSAWVGG